MLAVGGLPVFNVVVVKFYINCMVAINRCMIVLVLILIYTSLTVNYSYLRIIRLTKIFKGSWSLTPQASTFDGFMAVISFTLYPAYISSVVIVGFLFNKSSLNLYFLVVQGLVLYLSLGWGIDVLVHRITLTLPLVHWFQLRLLLVNWEYLVDSLSGIMLVIIALISLNVNVYSVDLLDVDTHQEQFIWLLAIFAIWITVFVMSNNLIVLFFCWELVGLCSYLLISFWKERQQSVKCSFKAILYNKVGDISLLLSIGCT